MKLSAEWKDRIVTAAIASLGTFIAGVILLHYEYTSFKSNPNYGNPRALLPSWRESRIITVSPVLKWSQFVLFNPRRYYKVFEIKLNGGDMGFPPNTALQISTLMGTIIQLTGHEAIRPTLADGTSAINWIDKKYKDSSRTVFVTGPNAGIEARLRVVVISNGKEPADNSLRLLVSPPGEKPLRVHYETDIQWP